MTNNSLSSHIAKPTVFVHQIHLAAYGLLYTEKKRNPWVLQVCGHHAYAQSNCSKHHKWATHSITLMVHALLSTGKI